MKKFILIIISVVLFSCGGSGSDNDSPTPPPTANTAPTVPFQVYPTNNLLCTDNPLGFTWNSSIDNENDSITYEIQVATNETFTNGVQTKTSSQTNVTFTLEQGVAYYWRIRSKDSKGKYSNYSPISKFYTEGEGITNHLPFTPTLVSPALNSTIVEVSTTLEWTASDVDNDPLVYDIYFGDINPPVLIAGDISESTYNVNLNTATTYYWKIVVKDNNGGQAIGQVWSFYSN